MDVLQQAKIASCELRARNGPSVSRCAIPIYEDQIGVSRLKARLVKNRQGAAAPMTTDVAIEKRLDDVQLGPLRRDPALHLNPPSPSYGAGILASCFWDATAGSRSLGFAA